MKPLVVANWKMKLNLAETIKLTLAYKKYFSKKAEVVICPSPLYIKEVGEILRRNRIHLGSQNVFWEETGAYTGEVSPRQLVELGCEYVIVGHSERRNYLAETDEMIHQKIAASLRAGLIPILCVGETFEQRQQGSQDYVLIRQVTSALEGIVIEPAMHVIIAYEPVWVIGTGQAIEPADAALAHRVIRQALYDLFDTDTVDRQMRIIYGGSVDEHNAAQFLADDEVSGVLVGGASLTIDQFGGIVKNL